jgi:pimeloyl-ACP methyl ester carboxylesterase
MRGFTRRGPSEFNDVEIDGRTLDLKDAGFVGHSVSCMIGVLAAVKAPDLLECLILVGPSARYIDEGDYVGGFSVQQIEELPSWRRTTWVVCADGAGHPRRGRGCRRSPTRANAAMMLDRSCSPG